MEMSAGLVKICGGPEFAGMLYKRGKEGGFKKNITCRPVGIEKKTLTLQVRK